MKTSRKFAIMYERIVHHIVFGSSKYIFYLKQILHEEKIVFPTPSDHLTRLRLMWSRNAVLARVIRPQSFLF